MTDFSPSTKTIDLSDQGLTTVPPQVFQCRQLVALNLRGNQLTEIPEALTKLTELSRLDLAGNQIAELPAQLSWLKKLSVLDMSGNRLSTLPPQIAHLRRLSVLLLQDNLLAALPPHMGHLEQLSQLNVSGNLLTGLPAQLAGLRWLTRLDAHDNEIASLGNQARVLPGGLTELDLSFNQLTELPAAIGRLHTLWQLNLAHNELASLPAEIGRLHSLKRLDISHNHLSVVPDDIGRLDRLEILDARGNQLASLPAHIAHLGQLRELLLAGNQLTSLPPELCASPGPAGSLTELDVSDNRLSSVPAEIAQLSRWCKLDLRANPLRSLPEPLIEQRALAPERLRQLGLTDDRGCDLVDGNTLAFRDPDGTVSVRVQFMRTQRVADNDSPASAPDTADALAICARADAELDLPAPWTDSDAFVVQVGPDDGVAIVITGTDGQPRAVQVTVGDKDALTGERHSPSLAEGRYTVCPPSARIDGYNLGDGTFCQLVAGGRAPADADPDSDVDTDTDTGADGLTLPASGVYLAVFQPGPAAPADDASASIEAGELQLEPSLPTLPPTHSAGSPIAVTVAADPHGLEHWQPWPDSRAQVLIVPG